MKLFVVLCLVAVAAAAPQNRGSAKYTPNYEEIQLLNNYFNNIGTGPFNFGYEQSDGQRRQEQGELRNEGREDAYVAVQGSFGWVGPDGITYNTKYTADENGYQPEIEAPGGAVPDAVIASLLG